MAEKTGSATTPPAKISGINYRMMNSKNYEPNNKTKI